MRVRARISCAPAVVVVVAVTLTLTINRFVRGSNGGVTIGARTITLSRAPGVVTRALGLTSLTFASFSLAPALGGKSNGAIVELVERILLVLAVLGLLLALGEPLHAMEKVSEGLLRAVVREPVVVRHVLLKLLAEPNLLQEDVPDGLVVQLLRLLSK